MSNGARAFLTLLAIFAVIAIGLFFPMENQAEEDLFRPDLSASSRDAFAADNPDYKLKDVATPHKVYSTTAMLRAGRFQYRPEDYAWTFTVPIDWAKRADALEVRRVIQRLSLADPFLLSYDETADVQDFKQAVFFFLDWQVYYQSGRKITDHSWDVDAVEGRMGRLAFILSEANRVEGLISDDETLRLIKFADFHIQRAADPVYGTQRNLSVDTPAFRAVCGVLERLESCERAAG